ncbi:MAG: hypothetical protein ACRENN_04715 [Candidatus Eiseniibacteriota bacterium]
MRLATCARRIALCALLSCAAAMPARAQDAFPDTGEATTPPPPPPPQAMPRDSTVSWTKAVQETRDQMSKRLTKIIFNVPRPSAPFQLAEDGSSETISEYTGLILGTPRWAPIEAWGERDYQALPTNSEEGEYRTVEMTIALNGVRGLSTGIASKADTPHIYTLPGALAVEQSTVGGYDSTRTDLAPDQRQTREPITLLRVYLVGANLESQLRAKFGKSGGFPGFLSGQLPSDHPDVVRTIAVEYYGAKSDVEGLVNRMDVPTLRRLLDQ